MEPYVRIQLRSLDGDKMFPGKLGIGKHTHVDGATGSVDGAVTATGTLGKLVRFGGFCGMYPYTWDKRSGDMTFKGHWKDRLWYQASAVLLYAYSAFLLVRTVSVWSGKEETPAFKMRMIYMCIVHLPLNGGHYFTLKHFGMHSLIFNELVVFYNFYAVKFGIKLHAKKVLLSMAALVISSSMGIMNSLEVLRNPGAPRLLSSLAADPKALPLGVKYAFSALHAYINAIQFFTNTVHGCTLVMYAFLVVPTVQHLRYKPNRWHRNSSTALNDQKRAAEIQEDYNRIVILQQVVRSVYGSWTLNFLIWLMLFVMFNVFQAVVKRSPRFLVLACAELYVLSQICTRCGNIYEESKKTWKSWGSIKNPGWFPKYKRANPPARLPIGSFFYFDKGVILTFVNIILAAAVNLIVSSSEA